MIKHFEGMTKTRLEDYSDIEKVLNALMRSWFMIMKGKQRLARNYRTSNNVMEMRLEPVPLQLEHVATNQSRNHHSTHLDDPSQTPD